MKAVAVFPRSTTLALIHDYPQPELETADEVELEVLEVGVCGTDREIARFEYGTPPAGEDHLVIGHECLSRVVRTGAAVRGLKPNELAVPMVRRPCPHASCLACRAERQDFCYTGDFVERGIKGCHGYMTERVVVEARWLVPVPESLREFGVLIEPLTIAEKALIQVRDVQTRLEWQAPGLPLGEVRTRTGAIQRQRALVLGAGPVGLLGAMALAAAHHDVFVFSREPGGGRKATIVEAIGATYLSARDHALAGVGKLTGRLDVIYEATGASRLAFSALPLLGTNGVFVFTGVPGRKAKVELDSARVMRDLVLRNQVVLGTVNAGRPAFDAAVRDLAFFASRWPDALASIITGRYPPEAFNTALSGAGPAIKQVIRFA